MYKFIYITLLVFSMTFICHAGKDIRTNLADIHVGQSDTDKCKIAISGRTITISDLDRESFVLVFDSAGRNVFKQTVEDNAVTIPVRLGGVYIIRIQNGDDIFTQKILVP